ncbi:hypothetical protein C7417_0100 [Cupriavidus plantarum]|nr:hypothetical protein C7417_0100 [Cupriavidus plantarum]
MTQNKPSWLLKTRAVSCSPLTGWASYPLTIAIRRARGLARTVEPLTDISSFRTVRPRDARRGPIEFSRARLARETRVKTANAVFGDILRSRFRTAGRGVPATEFISVRPTFFTCCRAPMNRSLDWGQAVSHLGSVGSPT